MVVEGEGALAVEGEVAVVEGEEVVVVDSNDSFQRKTKHVNARRHNYMTACYQVTYFCVAIRNTQTKLVAHLEPRQ